MSADNCTTYACERINDQFLVSSTKVVCPDISSCPDENIYIKGCCKYCNLTAESQSNYTFNFLNKLFQINIFSFVCTNGVTFKQDHRNHQTWKMHQQI